MSVNQPQVHFRYWNYLTGFQRPNYVFLFDIFYQDQLLLARLRYDRTMGFINHSQQIPSFPFPQHSVHWAISLRHSQIWRHRDTKMKWWISSNTDSWGQVTFLSPSHWLHLCICSLCHASGMTASLFLAFWLVKKDLCRPLIGWKRDTETWSITNRWGTTVSILI